MLEAMATRTSVLFRANVFNGGDNLVATVEAGHVWILKDWFFFNTGALLGHPSLKLKSPDGTIELPVEPAPGIAAGATAFTSGRFVVADGGTQIIVNLDTASFYVWGGGADLVQL